MRSVGDGGDGAIVAGVDLGGTKIQTIVVRGDEVLGQAREPTPRDGAAAVAASVVDSVRASLADAGVESRALSAVGIGAPGRIRDGVISNSPNMPGMQEPFPMGAAVSSDLDGVTVRIDNDVTVATLGEMHRGAGRPFSSFLSVFVGTGVGGGMVLGRAVWRGRGAAGEIGHMVVRINGAKCGCGRRGCMEAYAGRGAMEVHAREKVDKGEKTVLFEIMEEKGKPRLSSGIWQRALERDDKLAHHMIRQAVDALGVGIASSLNLLDVEAVVIGGGLGLRLGDPYVERIRDAVMPHLFADHRPPEILLASLGDLGGAIGATLLAADKTPAAA